MSDDARRLGAALMEANVARIPHATFSCTVSGKNIQEMGENAWEACRRFFGDQRFEITDLDADALQTMALEAIAYTARVRARAV